MKISAHVQILIALLLGVVTGSIVQYALGAEASDSKLVGTFEFLGKTVFIGLLKMVIVPLIFSSIVTGIAGLGSGEGFGRLGLKTLVYYISTSAIAIMIGLGVVNLIEPGLTNGEPNPTVKAFIDQNQAEFAKKGEQIAGTVDGVAESSHPLGVFGELVERMIPNNMFEVASSNGEMLGLITISLIVAFALVHTRGDGRDTVLSFVRGLNDLMIKITGWIMCLAPIGVFGLMAFTISQTGAGFLLSML